MSKQFQIQARLAGTLPRVAPRKGFRYEPRAVHSQTLSGGVDTPFNSYPSRDEFIDDFSTPPLTPANSSLQNTEEHETAPTPSEPQQPKNAEPTVLHNITIVKAPTTIYTPKAIPSASLSSDMEHIQDSTQETDIQPSSLSETSPKQRHSTPFETISEYDVKALPKQNISARNPRIRPKADGSFIRSPKEDTSSKDTSVSNAAKDDESLRQPPRPDQLEPYQSRVQQQPTLPGDSEVVGSNNTIFSRKEIQQTDTKDTDRNSNDSPFQRPELRVHEPFNQQQNRRQDRAEIDQNTSGLRSDIAAFSEVLPLSNQKRFQAAPQHQISVTIGSIVIEAQQQRHRAKPAPRVEKTSAPVPPRHRSLQNYLESRRSA